MTEIPTAPGPIPETGTLGVDWAGGVPWVTGGVHEQSTSSVHDEFLHAPSLQVRLLGHSLSEAQIALH